MSAPVKITIVGSGYVGLVAAACFAEIGHEVICVDNDEDKIRALSSGHVPIHEDMLPELLAVHRNTRLKFTTDLKKACAHAEAVFIAVGTPQDSSGNADLSYIDAVANQISVSVDSYKVLVEKSTVPVCTSDWVRRVLVRNGVPMDKFDVASNPEFLREGTAVHDFLAPDRIVIGCGSARATEVLQRIYEPLTSGSYYRSSSRCIPNLRERDTPRLLLTSTKSAELIKHASNAFLAMKISFVNAVANVCEAAGADIDEVASGLGMDSRIGARFLNPGIGYGGSCFPKDVAAFRYAAEQLGVNFGLLQQVQSINDNQLTRFLQKITSALWTLRGKRLGILGLAFKGGTDDIRDSPAIAMVRMLLREGCAVQLYDPAAMERARMVMPEGPAVQYVDSVSAAATNTDALLILTNWDEFARLDLAAIRAVMRYPIVIDGRNMYSRQAMAAARFDYLSVGRMPVYAASGAGAAHLPSMPFLPAQSHGPFTWPQKA